jgi:hypothetical protein
VVASFRTDDQNANRSGASNLHQFYITTKVGPVNVKVGDFYSTIGLISAIDADAIVAATAATINFFIIYSICCEKNLSEIAKMVLIIQVFIVKSFWRF